MNRLAASNEDEFNATHDRIARVRPAIVTLHAGSLTAAGWMALPNGLVLSSRRAIGYPTDVSIVPQEGMPLPGRVIAVDVARDVAMVLPLEFPGIVAPLQIRPAPAVRLTEPVSVVSPAPGSDLRIVPARVCQLHTGTGPKPSLFEIDIHAPLGAVVLDAEGRVVGMVATSTLGPLAATSTFTTVLPVPAFSALLGAMDRPNLELRDRTPLYRCPTCEEPYDIAAERCVACGRVLPHAFASTPERADAERLVRDGLAAIGVVANRARVSPTSWRFPLRPFSTAEATHLELTLDDASSTLTIRSPVVTLPTANHEPFYRFLLTMNDQTTGDLAVSIAGDLVSIGCAERLDGCGASALAARIEEIARVSDEYRRTLADTFEAGPKYYVP
ncbi:serine protease [Chondromyces apiculatus]|nr:serine protease [Chondromyces apiculatus]